MALITFDRIRASGERQFRRKMASMSAKSILTENTRSYARNRKFDIFLSHSYADAQIGYRNLLNLCGFFKLYGYSVYVDWIIDKELNRSKVTEKTAQTLRHRMNNSKCLLFATSKSSMHSRWMPWELGYKDGNSVDDSGDGMVAILPIVKSSKRNFQGQEYLGIYPYISESLDTDGNKCLWVNSAPNTYVSFDEWLEGMKPYKRK